jgi:hypothetical protein
MYGHIRILVFIGGGEESFVDQTGYTTKRYLKMSKIPSKIGANSLERNGSMRMTKTG